MQRFWLCWVEGTNGGRHYRHNTLEEAQIEAERLARKEMSSWRPDSWENPYYKEAEKVIKSLGSYTSGGYIDQTKIVGSAFEAGADAILKSLEPLIRQRAPSSKLVDILYPKEK